MDEKIAKERRDRQLVLADGSHVIWAVPNRISACPLIPAIKAMCEAGKGEKLEIIMDDAAAFNDMKEYLSEQQIGFRERCV